MASPPADVRAVLDALRQIVRALRLSAAEAERGAGVSGAQLFLLQRLAERPARSLTELAERTLTDPSSVSAVVGRLEERGLILRSRAQDDGRRSEIALSRRGAALLEKSPLAAQARLVDALTNLPGLTRRALAQGLSQLAQTMGAAEEPPHLFFEEEMEPPGGKRAAGMGLGPARAPAKAASAPVSSARAKVKAASAPVSSAKAKVKGAKAKVKAARGPGRG